MGARKEAMLYHDFEVEKSQENFYAHLKSCLQFCFPICLVKIVYDYVNDDLLRGDIVFRPAEELYFWTGEKFVTKEQICEHFDLFLEFTPHYLRRGFEYTSTPCPKNIYTQLLLATCPRSREQSICEYFSQPYARTVWAISFSVLGKHNQQRNYHLTVDELMEKREILKISRKIYTQLQRYAKENRNFLFLDIHSSDCDDQLLLIERDFIARYD